APLAPKFPLGSLVYETSVPGIVNSAGDTDSLAITIDPGQTLTVVVTADSASLQPTVQLLDAANVVLASSTAAAAGRSALLQTIPVPAGGNYVVKVGGANLTTGNYTVRAYLNAAVEAADIGIGTSSTLATA